METEKSGRPVVEPNITVTDDGTVTGYDGTSHLSFLCDTTVDSAEHTANVYKVDVTARTSNRDKTILGTPTVVTCSNTFIAPALGGLTEVGERNG